MSDDKIKKVKKFHDQETSHYFFDRYLKQSCEQVSYITRKQIVLDFLYGAGGNILDAGCGPAIFTLDLIKMGLKPFSVDLSLEMLKAAKSAASIEDRTFWLNSEIEKLPFRNEVFENIISIGVIAYAKDTMSAVNELARTLKPGGMLLIQCSNPMAPTPILQSIKDRILVFLGLRTKRWNFRLTSHSFRHFQTILKNCGFRIEAKRCYDFRLPFIEKFFPRTAIYLMIKIQTLLQDSYLFGWLGEGYIVKACKIK